LADSGIINSPKPVIADIPASIRDNLNLDWNVTEDSDLKSWKQHTSSIKGNQKLKQNGQTRWMSGKVSAVASKSRSREISEKF
jgi:hypothetical protein